MHIRTWPPVKIAVRIRQSGSPFLQKTILLRSTMTSALFLPQPLSFLLDRFNEGWKVVLARKSSRISWVRCSPARILEFRKSPRRCGRRRLCIRKKSLETAARFRPSSLCLSIHLLNSPRFRE